jgi:hypothetical protein
MPGELTETRNGERRPYEGPNAAYDEPSLGTLFASLTNDVSLLIRQEIQLARTETMEKVSSATRNVVLMAAGGMVAYAGVITLVIAAVIALGTVIPLWLSALIIGAVVVIIGLVLLQSGRSGLKQMSVVPEKTVQSLQEDAQLVKEKVS